MFCNTGSRTYRFIGRWLDEAKVLILKSYNIKKLLAKKSQKSFAVNIFYYS